MCAAPDIGYLPGGSRLATIYAAKLLSQDTEGDPRRAYAKLKRRLSIWSGPIKRESDEVLRASAFWRLSLNAALAGETEDERRYQDMHMGIAQDLCRANQFGNAYMIEAYISAAREKPYSIVRSMAEWGMFSYWDASSLKSLPHMLLIDGGMEIREERGRPSGYAKIFLARNLMAKLDLQDGAEGDRKRIGHAQYP